MARSYAAATVLAIAIICTGCGATTATKQTTDTAEEAQASVTAAGDKTVAIESGPEPSWVTGESKEHPRFHYITSRTEATTPEQAAEQAIANITRYFVVDTTEFSMTLEQATVAANYELNTTNLDESTLTVGSPEVSRVLEKIEVVSQWYDSANNRYHALAALPRNTGRGYLEDQIKELDKKTEALMEEARAHPDPFAQAGFIAKAWRCQQIRSKLQESMRIADLTARGIEPKYNLRLMKQDALNLLTTLQIEPTGVAGEMNAIEVATMIKGGLVTADLKPAQNSADYVMRGTLDPTIIGERNGWAVGQGQLKLVLADKVTGEVLGTKMWEIEVPGLTEDHAIRRVYEKTEYKLKRDMRDILMEMAMQ